MNYDLKNPIDYVPPGNIPPTPELIPEPQKPSVTKIIIGVVVVLLLIAGVVLATGVWDPLWNPFRPNPEKVLARMTDKMSEVESMKTKMTIEADKVTFVMDIQTSGDIDDYVGKGSFQINIDDGLPISIGGEYIEINRESFFRINKLPDLSLLGLDLSFLNDTWIKSENQAEEVDQALIDKISEALKGKEILVIEEELPNEEVNGKKAFHFKVGINEEVIRESLKDIIIDLYIESLDSSPLAIPIESDEEIDKAMDEMIDLIGKLDIDIWVGRRDYLPYKIEVNKDQFMLRTEFSEFDEPVEVEAPGSFKTLEEIMEMLMFGSFPMDAMRESVDDLIPILSR